MGTLARREFLATLGAGLAGAACGVAGEGADSAGASGAWRLADGGIDWGAVRAEFRLRPDRIHLGSFYLVSHPRPVREAIERYRERIDADPLWIEEACFAEGEENRILAVKRALARYVSGAVDEIALTSNTTTGLAMVYNGLRIRSGQEIVTTRHDHYVHHESIRRAAEKSGAGVRFVALHDGASRASREEIVARVRAAIGPRTRALGVTWVHSSTGLKLPIREIAEAVAEANRGRAAGDRCLLVVDGVHGFGIEPTPAATLGADFFVAGTHKWLFAPRGTGMIWGRADAWPQVAPTIPTFDLSDDAWAAWIDKTPLPPTRASFVSPGGFLAYEHLFAVPDAIAFHEAIGRERIADRVHELNGAFRRELARMPGVTLHTPVARELSAGICCFEVAGLATREVVTRLAARGIHATESPYEPTLARVAAGIMNTPAEVETTLAAIRGLAGGAA